MQSITLIPIGGLANRIYTITSAIDFCVENNIQLKVYWFKDKGMGAGFNDLFQLSSQYENVKVIDARWYDYRYDRPRKKNLWLPYIYQRTVFDALYFEKELYSIKFAKWHDNYKKSDKLYVVHCSKLKDNISFKHLIPNSENMLLINNARRMLTDSTIGIHIRRTDNVTAIADSPTSLFISAMQNTIEENPNTTFFVASDSEEEKNHLKTLFEDRVITRNSCLRRDTKDGIIDALVELYTLSATKKILGSKYSTYSTLAAEIGNIPIEILSY